MTRVFEYKLAQRGMELLILTTLIWGIIVTVGWSADLAPTPASENIQASVSAEKTSSTGQTLASAPANQPELSQDFLANTSPLSKPDSATQTVAPEVSVISIEGASRQCNSTGDAYQGSQSCIERHPDGSFMESISSHEKRGDEKKEQTVIRYYRADGKPAGEDTTRVKINYYPSTTTPEREYYDIVMQPVRGKINRDLIIREFDSTGKAKKTTWAHYIEMGVRKAGLEHHAVIYYQNGQLASGFANQYRNGKIIDNLLNYKPSKNPNLRLEKTGIIKWTHWIDQLIRQADSARI